MLNMHTQGSTLSQCTFTSSCFVQITVLCFIVEIIRRDIPGLNRELNEREGEIGGNSSENERTRRGCLFFWMMMTNQHHQRGQL